ncbi:hypothetical protein F2P81_002190 [Scophthalmus maximus]|uniref:Uncharacterized protein n=1 Tax=Scophthalmus maximus TaxID=52904 RepID=A0A6A4TSH3_SCOMX|nr:hypothetical protein F2P81_002190 [Scophthalmus maximus]
MGPGTLESTGSVCMSHCSLMSAGQEPDFPGDEAFASRFPVHRACRDGDVGALVSLTEQLAQSRAHLAAEDSCCGWTPLHWAAHYGQLECVVRLVQMGCGVNTVTSRFNQTPTHTAAFGGHPHCVVWLTQAGADVNRQLCHAECEPQQQSYNNQSSHPAMSVSDTVRVCSLLVSAILQMSDSHKTARGCLQ